MVRHLQSNGLNDWQFQSKAGAMMMAYPAAAKVMNQPRVIDSAILAPYPKNSVVPGPWGLAAVPPRAPPPPPPPSYAYSYSSPTPAYGLQNDFKPLIVDSPQMMSNPSYAYGLQNEIKSQPSAQGAYGLQNEMKSAQPYTQAAYGLQNEIKSQPYAQTTYYPDGMIGPKRI